MRIAQLRSAALLNLPLWAFTVPRSVSEENRCRSLNLRTKSDQNRSRQLSLVHRYYQRGLELHSLNWFAFRIGGTLSYVVVDGSTVRRQE
jgi:hypothetical protein